MKTWKISFLLHKKYGQWDETPRHINIEAESQKAAIRKMNSLFMKWQKMYSSDAANLGLTPSCVHDSTEWKILRVQSVKPEIAETRKVW